jgi:DNA replication protein DnaC
MSLTNEQTDRILRGYEETRDANRALTERKQSMVYLHLPQLRDLEDKIADLSVRQTKETLRGDDAKAAETAEELKALRRERLDVLATGGYTPSDLEPVYTCPDCQDTGFIRTASGIRRKCHCFRSQELEILYEQSNIRTMLETENFSRLTYDHVSDEDLINLRAAVDSAQEFVHNFKTDYRNLVFYGTVGTGKSFLSGCIAAELLKQYYSVLYLSSQRLFDKIAVASFGGGSREDREELFRDLYDCDLLIVDDLGAETMNNFVSTQLFTLINERHLRRKATIISTNLSLTELRDRYSDRILSRLTGSYTFRKLTGPDLRMQKQHK